jgi:hypothetical protein
MLVLRFQCHVNKGGRPVEPSSRIGVNFCPDGAVHRDDVLHHQSQESDSQSMWVCYIADLFFACVGFLFVWFYWKGRNWARVSVMVVSGLSIWNLRMWDVPVNLALHFYPALLVTPFRVWLVYKALLGAVLLYYLNTPEPRKFFTGKQTGHEQVSMAAK